MVDLGFELGNRTKTGYYLGNAKSAEKVQQEVGLRPSQLQKVSTFLFQTIIVRG